MKIITKITALLLLALLVLPVFSTITSPTAFALDSKGAACEGIDLAGGGCGSGAGGDVTNVIASVVTLLSFVVGIAAVIMIIIAGFKYITSGGESSSVAGAKNTLIYAIVGLLIVALAQFIVHFVLKSV
jgi:hypothetical protein